MKFKRILYAPNIHQGGGRALLLPLLLALEAQGDLLFALDQRIELPAGIKLAGRVFRIPPTLRSRLGFEWRLRKLIAQDAVVLCMGNLPPLFAHQGMQTVFVQNRYLIEALPLSGFPRPIRMRIRIERRWLRSRARFVRSFIVQTQTMKNLLMRALQAEARILPFVAEPETNPEKYAAAQDKRYDFLYVATGEPHKNHRTLIEAWIELSRRGIFPSLCLTLEQTRFPELCGWIAGMTGKHALRVFMIGECTDTGIGALYRDSRALIYPSLHESLGLPLIEAVRIGLPVLAGRADYVDDVIEAGERFDPGSPGSIADAVSSFSFTRARLKIKLIGADVFLKNTLYPAPERAGY